TPRSGRSLRSPVRCCSSRPIRPREGEASRTRMRGTPCSFSDRAATFAWSESGTTFMAARARSRKLSERSRLSWSRSWGQRTSDRRARRLLASRGYRTARRVRFLGFTTVFAFGESALALVVLLGHQGYYELKV